MKLNAVLLGDVREQLDTLDRHSVHCVVTSPPYWALRDYGVDGQLGLEATPAEYIANQVDVFQRVHRVLRPDGVLWVNLGDTYAQGSKWGGSSGNKNELENGFPRSRKRRGDDRVDGNQLLIPYRFAIAMQDAGWILRSTVIWHKKSPMPESLTGTRWRGDVLRRGSWRPTNAHEPVFMFVKAMNYFCDGDAASEPVSGTGHGVNPKCSAARELVHGKQNATFSGRVNNLVERRNPRSVLSLSSEPFKGSHFAAYPTQLVRRLIEWSTSSRGCCATCGSPLAPMVETERVATRPGTDSKVGKRGVAIESAIRPERPNDPNIVGNRDPQRHMTRTHVLGYRPTCECVDAAVNPEPCVVLDPYAGSGTTLQVAHQLGRSYLGIELNPDYLPLIEQRINTPLPKPKTQRSSRAKRRTPQQAEFAFQ